MGPANAAGPPPPTCPLPGQGSPAELRHRIAAGEWVADLRSRRVFAAGHRPGSLSFEHGGAFASYLGWLQPDGPVLSLIGESTGPVAAGELWVHCQGATGPAWPRPCGRPPGGR